MARTLGVDLSNRDRLDEDEPLLREAHAGQKKALGADHAFTLAAGHAHATVLQRQGRFEEALLVAKELWDVLRDPGRAQVHPRLRAQYLCIYGICLAGVRRHEESIEPLLEARTAMHETGQPTAPHLAAVLAALVKSSGALGRHEEAERFAAELAPLNAATQAAATRAAAQAAATTRSR